MKIKIEDGLEVIDQDIVRLLNYDYPSTQFVELPNSLKEIKERSFAGCISLQTITIPNGVTRIGKDAFACCRQLRSVTFPISLQLIDEYAFSHCGSLQYINFPETLQEIKEGCFEHCSSLQSISIPNGVIRIDRKAFARCANLQSVILPQSLQVIDRCAFFRCSSLQTISIPNKATNLGLHAFTSCDKLHIQRLGERGLNDWLRTRFDELPLHKLCYNINETTESKLTSIQANAESFLEIDAMGMTPLHILCSNPCATPNMIKQLLSKNQAASHIRNADGMTASVMYLICKNLISYKDYKNGERSEIINLLQEGAIHTLSEMIWMRLGYDVMDVISAFNQKCIGEELYVRDEATGFFPFMITALSRDYELGDLYNIVRKAPTLLKRTNVMR